MPTMMIEVSDATAADLAELARRCTQADKDRDGATTHGPLEPTDLVMMLIEDVTKVISRPGSWEGSGMDQYLASHGYEL